MATAAGSEEAHVQDQAYLHEVEHSGQKHEEDECSKKEVFVVADRCGYEGKRKISSSGKRWQNICHQWL